MERTGASILEEIGFTKAEAQTYLTLLGLGPSKVGAIITKSGLQSSTIHNTLHTLIDGGFVSYILKGKIKIYSAAEPGMIMRAEQEKLSRLQHVLPELELKRKLSEQRTTAEVFEGIKGLTTMMNHAIGSARPGDPFFFFNTYVEGEQEEIQEFFRRFDGKRRERKLDVRGLAPARHKKIFEQRPYIKMRYMHTPIPSNLSLCNNYLLLITWGERPTGVLLYSRQLYEVQVRFFKELWNHAKP